MWSERADSWAALSLPPSPPVSGCHLESLQARTVIDIEPGVFVGDSDKAPRHNHQPLQFVSILH